MRPERLILLSLLVLSAAANASSQRFVLVVHPSNPISVISKERVSDIFLKKETTWSNGVAIEVIDQHPRSKSRASFTSVVHGRTVSAIKSHWHREIFTGRGLPPTEAASEEGVIEYVASHPGSIGYVSSRVPIGTLKAVRLEP